MSAFIPLAVGFFGLGTGYLIYGPQELFKLPGRDRAVDLMTGIWGIWMPGFMQFLTGVLLFVRNSSRTCTPPRRGRDGSDRRARPGAGRPGQPPEPRPARRAGARVLPSRNRAVADVPHLAAVLNIANGYYLPL